MSNSALNYEDYDNYDDDDIFYNNVEILSEKRKERARLKPSKKERKAKTQQRKLRRQYEEDIYGE